MFRKQKQLPRLPRKASLALRLIASAILLAYLLTRFPADDLQERWPDWQRGSWVWLVASLLATLSAFMLASLRWLQVCKTLGYSPTFSRVSSHFLAGQFVGNFLPTTVGGDILRVTRMGAEIRDPSGAFASVIIERLTGWIVLPVITFVALVVRPDLVGSRAGTIALAGALATLAILVVLIFLAEHPNFGGRLSGENRLSAALAAVHQGLKSYRSVPRGMTELLLIAVAFQFFLIVAVICAANAIGIEFSLVVWFAFVPIVFVAQVLPIAIGGLGVREAALVLFLSSFGVSSGQSVVLGLIVYAITLIASLVGAVPYILGSRQSDAGGKA